MKNLLFLMLMPISIAAWADGSSIGPGNPAAYNCVKLEGKLEPQQDGTTICAIDQWHLFQEMSERGLVKPKCDDGDDDAKIPNPAAENCLDIGGELDVFSSDCRVEQWTLFRAIDVTNEK